MYMTSEMEIRAINIQNTSKAKAVSSIYSGCGPETSSAKPDKFRRLKKRIKPNLFLARKLVVLRSKCSNRELLTIQFKILHDALKCKTQLTTIKTFTVTLIDPCCDL